MPTLLVVVLASFVITTFFGHAIHWALHQRWTGLFYRSHMDHHVKQYPPKDLTSSTYRLPSRGATGFVLFTPAFLIILGAAGGLLWLFGLPLWILAVLGPVMLGYGLLNDHVHDAFHVDNHLLSRFAWFSKLQRSHFIHHRNMKVNFGIINFTWDRVFGTFRVRDRRS